MELSSRQKRFLRAEAHHLDAVVLVGTAGLTEAVLAKVNAELENHELIKVKIGKEAPIDVEAGAEAISAALKAGVAQIIGRTMVLYRRRKEKPSIQLPKD